MYIIVMQGYFMKQSQCILPPKDKAKSGLGDQYECEPSCYTVLLRLYVLPYLIKLL